MRKSLRAIVEEDRKRLDDLRITSKRDRLVYKILDDLKNYTEIPDKAPKCFKAGIEQLACYGEELCFPIGGKRRKTVEPHILKYNGWEYTQYTIRCIGSFNFLRRNRRCEEELDVVAEYSLLDIRESFKFDGKRRKKNYNLVFDIAVNFEFENELPKEYKITKSVNTNIVSPYMLSGGNGFVIKKTNMHGAVCIGDEKFRFGNNFHDREIIVYYSKGKTFFYGLDGEMVFPVLNHLELGRSYRLSKALEIKEKSKDFDLEEYAVDALKYLEREWLRNPDLFKVYGKIIIVDGRIQRIVCLGRSMINLRILKNNNELLDGLYAAPECGEKVWADIKGKSIFIYGKENYLVNAHSLDSFFSIHGIEGNHDIKRMVFLRPKRVKNRDLKIQVLSEPYRFSRAAYNSLVRDRNTVERTALLVDYRKDVDPIFHLLIKRNGNNGGCEKHPIKPKK